MINPGEDQRLLDLIRARRSVRRFSPKAIPQELLLQILESATWAPSAHNRQPWQFVVLATLVDRARFVEMMGDSFRQDLLSDGLLEGEVEVAVNRARLRVMQAPVAILLCQDISLGDPYPDQRRQNAEYFMGVQSVAMAGSTLLLAASASGLGGVWLCAPIFAPEIARSALGLPEEWEPQGLILLGYPSMIPEARSRRPVEDIVRYV